MAKKSASLFSFTLPAFECDVYIGLIKNCNHELKIYNAAVRLGFKFKKKETVTLRLHNNNSQILT